MEGAGMERERYKEVVREAEVLVKKVMDQWDSSHDAFHALRVRDLALSLASEEHLPTAAQQIVELASLLHDIDDHKYVSRDDEEHETAEQFLVRYNVPVSMVQSVTFIIHNMGFKEELSGLGKSQYTLEFGIVQDADRLDAIGAIVVNIMSFCGEAPGAVGGKGSPVPAEAHDVVVLRKVGMTVGIHLKFLVKILPGIARVFTFGGSRNHIIHDPSVPLRMNMTKEEYMKQEGKKTGINHFYEKLLKLKDLMKTEAGRRRAEGRHKFLENFLTEFYGEWEGKL